MKWLFQLRSLIALHLTIFIIICVPLHLTTVTSMLVPVKLVKWNSLNYTSSSSSPNPVLLLWLPNSFSVGSYKPYRTPSVSPPLPDDTNSNSIVGVGYHRNGGIRIRSSDRFLTYILRKISNSLRTLSPHNANTTNTKSTNPTPTNNRNPGPGTVATSTGTKKTMNGNGTDSGTSIVNQNLLGQQQQQLMFVPLLRETETNKPEENMTSTTTTTATDRELNEATTNMNDTKVPVEIETSSGAAASISLEEQSNPETIQKSFESHFDVRQSFGVPKEKGALSRSWKRLFGGESKRKRFESSSSSASSVSSAVSNRGIRLDKYWLPLNVTQSMSSDSWPRLVATLTFEANPESLQNIQKAEISITVKQPDEGRVMPYLLYGSYEIINISKTSKNKLIQEPQLLGSQLLERENNNLLFTITGFIQDIVGNFAKILAIKFEFSVHRQCDYNFSSSSMLIEPSIINYCKILPDSSIASHFLKVDYIQSDY